MQNSLALSLILLLKSEMRIHAIVSQSYDDIKLFAKRKMNVSTVKAQNVFTHSFIAIYGNKNESIYHGHKIIYLEK